MVTNKLKPIFSSGRVRLDPFKDSSKSSYVRTNIPLLPASGADNRLRGILFYAYILDDSWED